MPSIQARTYPVSAMVPSTVPSPAATNTTKTSVQKTETVVAPSNATSSVSDRVTAFLASDATTETSTERPNRPPPPPGGPGGPQGAGESEASSESETALLLLEEADAAEDVDDVDEDTDEDTETLTTAVLFDEAKNYYPTSLY